MILSKKTINYLNEEENICSYLSQNPFPYMIIDDFFREEIASEISSEFPPFESSFLDNYSNAIEEKKLVNQWNKFKKSTYKALNYLCSAEFTGLLSKFVPDSKNFQSDIGLHGGGLHMHKKGGKLNVHMDYSLHPKLELQRKLNILIYMTKNWDEKWGGSLGLYDNKSEKEPGQLIKKIFPIFNRAVIFDVTKNSWHGLPEKISCPENITRNSLAVYYLQNPDKSANPKRVKARFAPSPWQEGDKEVLELIEKRSGLESSKSVYD